MILTISCNDDNEQIMLSDENDIISFSFLTSDNANLSQDYVGVVLDNTILVTVPFNTDVSTLSPTILVSENATISPETNIEIDYSGEVVYTVTSESGIEQQYTVTVIIAPNDENNLLSFSFLSSNNTNLSQNYIGVIEDNTVTTTMPFGTDVSNLIPTTVVSNNATVSPANGTEIDFSNDVVFTITSESGIEQPYTVTVIIAPNDENSLLSFSFLSINNSNLSQDYIAIIENNTVTISSFPFNTDISNLVPTITVSDNATVNPETGIEVDFNSTTSLIVTSESLLENTYTINLLFEEFIIPDTNTEGEYIKWIYNSPLNTLEDFGTIFLYDDQNRLKVIASNFTQQYFTTYDEIFTSPVYANNIKYYIYGANNKVSEIRIFNEENALYKYEANQVYNSDTNTNITNDISSYSSTIVVYINENETLLENDDITYAPNGFEVNQLLIRKNIGLKIVDNTPAFNGLPTGGSDYLSDWWYSDYEVNKLLLDFDSASSANGFNNRHILTFNGLNSDSPISNVINPLYKLTQDFGHIERDKFIRQNYNSLYHQNYINFKPESYYIEQFIESKEEEETNTLIYTNFVTEKNSLDYPITTQFYYFYNNSSYTKKYVYQ